jgi:polyphosphate kinase
VFGADRVVPAWLLQPWQTLQSAAQRQRPLAARLGDLVQLADEVDELFVEYLPRYADWFRGPDAAGLSLQETLPRWVDGLVSGAGGVVQQQVRPDVAAAGLTIRPVVQVDEAQRAWLHHYFMQRVYPLLTPLAVDPGRPFPFISSDSLNLLVELYRPEHATSRASVFARVKIPANLPRLVAVPGMTAARVGPGQPTRVTRVMVCTADLVRYFVHHLFTGMPVRHVYLFRVVRGEQPLPGMPCATVTRHRRHEDRPVVRLDVERRMVEPVLAWLVEHLRVPRYAVAQHDRLFDWTCLPHLMARLHELAGVTGHD